MLCECNIAHPCQNASTGCGNAIKATQLLWDIQGLCVYYSIPTPKRKDSLWQRNKSHPAYVALCGAVRAFAGKFSKFAANVQKAAALFCYQACWDVLRCQLALCEAYGSCGCSAGDCNCQRAARAKPRRHQAQALAQWALAAWAWSQHCRCPRAFCPPERCFDAVRTQLRPVACHLQPLDVVAVVCQHHEIY